MFSERTQQPVLPFIAAQPLTDHHCHGVLREGGDLETLLTEGDGRAVAGGSAFDSLAGLAFRRWCPPLLGLPAHASLAEYEARRRAVGGAEVNRRFLAASGLGALCVDTGYTPQALLSPAETAAFAGAAAFEVVRLEQVAETLARANVSPADFPDAYRAALAARVGVPGTAEPGTAEPGTMEPGTAEPGTVRPASRPRVPVVAVKSIAAYRVGLALDARRPRDDEVAAAAGRWLRGPDGGAGLDGGSGPDGGTGAGGMPRLADETLHRFFVWCGAELGLPIQFHVGYGDRDIDLHKCNPLLLTDLLRALEPTGVPVMLLHNYPYHREAGYLAQVFPHVHVDLGLATHNVGSRAPEVLAEALEMAPLRKFLFSSDAFGLPELYYLGTLLFRRALSRFLQVRLDADDISRGDAERITRLIGAENARRAYGVPVP